MVRPIEGRFPLTQSCPPSSVDQGRNPLPRASPEITRGEHADDSIALDHVLPRAVVPELEARFYNLEAVPSKVNRRKSADLTSREISLARRWHREGLLSADGLAAVEKAAAVP